MICARERVSCSIFEGEQTLWAPRLGLERVERKGNTANQRFPRQANVQLNKAWLLVRITVAPTTTSCGTLGYLHSGRFHVVQGRSDHARPPMTARYARVINVTKRKPALFIPVEARYHFLRSGTCGTLGPGSPDTSLTAAA